MLATARRGATTTMSRVRLVLFDAFDTLITPRLPIHVQYAEEARKAGLDVQPEAVRGAFKSAFKAVTAKYPEWGRTRLPTPMTAEEWWTVLIRETFVRAGVEEGAVEASMETLGPSLLRRFESSEGYRQFDDVIPALTALRDMDVRTGVISNADSRILKTLGCLSITPLLTAPTTLSQCCGYEKPDERIFKLAVSRSGVGDGQDGMDGVIFVGDELEADYDGAMAAGLEARLLRRPGEWSDGAQRASESEEALQQKGVRVIRGLQEIVDEVRTRNRS